MISDAAYQIFLIQPPRN